MVYGILNQICRKASLLGAHAHFASKWWINPAGKQNKQNKESRAPHCNIVASLANHIFVNI